MNRVMPEKPTYPFERIAFGKPLEVAPGIHWVRMPLPFALDHINLWLVEDGQGWTVIDSGYNSDEVRGHWEAIFDSVLGGKPVTRVIITHWHPDHLGLGGWFAERWGLTLWMTYAEWLQAHLGRTDTVILDVERWIDFFIENGLDSERVEAYRDGRTDFNRIMSAVPPKVRRIWDNGTFTIGGHEWRVITGGGHSPEHASLYCADLNVLISGDQVLPRITTNISLWYTEPEGDPLGQFIASFEKFRDLPEDVLVLPSHNRPFHGLHDRLDALTDHHEDRLEEAFRASAEPRTATEIIPVLFPRAFEPRQLGLAMGEALSHLNYLVEAGRFTRTRDGDGIIRYQAIDPGAARLKLR